MKEGIRKDRERFEEKLRQKVETHVPDELQEEFWAYYNTCREQVREQVLMNMRYAIGLYESDADHEGITIESVLNVWSQDQQGHQKKKLSIDHV